ncbi:MULTISPECIES: glycosyltransferase [Gammaproteobacteria]|jgi:glycosyltransferase involved in cell wall biosynthesis|uniref:glycosyltransferase n=1 Tax=Gammaproteobacteria TaxID=1236 RepID=UPI000C68156D|nr:MULTISPECIES: glycosyltransferase [Gammaproteobacteria]MBU73756.1 glycosyl transferase [Spongiibacter sp.]HCP20356.1 glycosyl transferase [Marinobacter nauticus]|tara:strand:+ start:2434 stop:3486 length:1053 start_codon:yes stop_codon:yes gene_type:complete
MSQSTETIHRVAQVLAGAERGGAENFFVRLVKGLQATGKVNQQAFIRAHQHRIDALESGGVPTRGFRFGGQLNLLDRMRYHRALREFHPDIVMTWMNRASIATPPGDYTLISRLGHYYNLKYYRHADYWVGISKGICDHLIQGGMPADRVFYIPNFADETPVEPLPRDSFETPSDRPLILAAGRLHENKGFDILLQALKKVPDATLWLAGSGPEEQPLKQQCHELGLDDRVRFLGWRDDVTTLMKTADLFVCPSRHEGLGSIVMESWAHECPIIATNSQGPGELIDSGQTGIITPIDEPQALADAIRELLQNPEESARLVQNASEHYWKHFSRSVIVDQYLDLYRSIQQK